MTKLWYTIVRQTPHSTTSFKIQNRTVKQANAYTKDLYFPATGMSSMMCNNRVSLCIFARAPDMTVPERKACFFLEQISSSNSTTVQARQKYSINAEKQTLRH